MIMMITRTTTTIIHAFAPDSLLLLLSTGMPAIIVDTTWFKVHY